MKYNEYIDAIKSRFEKHFHIDTDILILDNKIDLYARFFGVTGRTFITKNDVIDRYENFEYCYIKRCDDITQEDILGYVQFLKRVVNECIKPGKDHMSTYVTGVIIGNIINDDAKAIVKKHSYSKAYSFYLKGWCDVRLICVGLSDNEVITNKAGRKVKNIYESLLV